MFWLFLILRIAKNYLGAAVFVDERSDNEEGEEDVDGSEDAAVVVGQVNAKEAANAKEEAKRKIESNTGMETDRPAVLTNGKPVSGEAHPEGIVERRKKR